MPKTAVAALFLCALPLLGGCNAAVAPAVGYALGDASSIMVFHRGIADLLVSTVSGRDCSVVRLDRGQTYCRPIEPRPPAPPYCTHTLGAVDCWASPIIPTNPARGLADGPQILTPEQEADRTRRWPEIFSIFY